MKPPGARKKGNDMARTGKILATLAGAGLLASSAVAQAQAPAPAPQIQSMLGLIDSQMLAVVAPMVSVSCFSSQAGCVLPLRSTKPAVPAPVAGAVATGGVGAAVATGGAAAAGGIGATTVVAALAGLGAIGGIVAAASGGDSNQSRGV